MFTEWIPVSHGSPITLDLGLESKLLQLRWNTTKDSAILMHFRDRYYNPLGSIAIVFRDHYYKIGYCSYWEPLLAAIPNDGNVLLTIARRPGPILEVYSNNVLVIEHVFSDTTCNGASYWREFWTWSGRGTQATLSIYENVAPISFREGTSIYMVTTLF